MARIGIIGGTGLYEMLGIENVQEVEVKTPFGAPSDKLFIGNFLGKEVVFLPRHGRKHTILPGEINYKANIAALKLANVSKIVSISAVGSLKEELKPGEMVVIDQFFDRTNRRKDNTFFGNGIVAHISFAEPVCEDLRKSIILAAEKFPEKFHKKGVYVNIEGPAFSTKAESLFYKAQGFDVIGMTNLVEAKLAREAQMCYATIAMVTDYDCWKQDEESVNVEIIIETLRKNAQYSMKVVKEAISIIDPDKHCQCNESLKYAIVTKMENVPDETRSKLSFILGDFK